MTRSIAFGDRDGLDWVRCAQTSRMMIERLPLLTPEREEAMLREAGFGDIQMFHAALSFRGFIATA